MKLTYVPLLKIQRELYALPRGYERFQEYLATMVDPETRDMKLPLAAMNPMAKEHAPTILDQYLALNVDQLAAEATQSAEKKLRDFDGNFSVTLVLADDAKGGWTNRYASEYYLRFSNAAYHKRGWITGTLWTSETPDVERALLEILTAIHRTAFIQQFGIARTLREMLAQEGFAMHQAGYSVTLAEKNEIEYTREVITPFLDSTDYPTLFACLFGDKAAYTFGYSQPGLSERAGFSLALHDAEQQTMKSSTNISKTNVHRKNINELPQ